MRTTTITNETTARAREIKLADELQEMLDFVPGIRRAPDQGFRPQLMAGCELEGGTVWIWW
jgi:hypothetical protein